MVAVVHSLEPCIFNEFPVLLISMITGVFHHSLDAISRIILLESLMQVHHVSHHLSMEDNKKVHTFLCGMLMVMPNIKIIANEDWVTCCSGEHGMIEVLCSNPREVAYCIWQDIVCYIPLELVPKLHSAFLSALSQRSWTDSEWLHLTNKPKAHSLWHHWYYWLVLEKHHHHQNHQLIQRWVLDHLQSSLKYHCSVNYQESHDLTSDFCL